MAEWDLKDLLGGQDIDDIVEGVKKDVATFVTCRDELEQEVSPARLLELIKLKEKIIYDLGAVESYYGLKFSENTKDEEALAAMTKYDQLGTELGNQMLFFSLWLMHLDDETAKGYIDAPELSEYKYYIEEVRKAKNHTKSEEIEQIINLKNMTSGAFSDLYEILTNGFTFDFDGKTGLSQEEIRSYVHDKDPAKRQGAYEVYLQRYKEHSTILGEIYKNIVLDWYNEGVKIRGYNSPLSIRGIKNDIEDEAVQTLLRVVRKNVSMFNNYFKLKHSLNEKHGASYEFSRYHLYAPFALQSDEKHEYEDSKKIVLETYKQFDSRFHDAAISIFERDHVHSHPKTDKRSGAFCSYLGRRCKPYILLNHTDKVRDVFTMMHEFGHGIHGILAEKQPDMLVHASLPMAETASIFGETLLVNRLLSESKDDTTKIAMLVQQLDDRWASIVRQSYFVMFEMEAHEMIRAGATKKELDDKYKELMRERFADMEVPELFSYEWSYVPHMFATPFYCYAYAWGNLLALSLYGMYSEDASFKEKIVTLLAHGGSMSPKNMLAEIGIDPNDEGFWQKGFDIIKSQIESLKNLSEKK